MRNFEDWRKDPGCLLDHRVYVQIVLWSSLVTNWKFHIPYIFQQMYSNF